MTQSAGAVEYIDCIIAEELDPPPSVPDVTLNNLSNTGFSNTGALGNVEYPFFAIAPRFTQACLFVK